MTTTQLTFDQLQMQWVKENIESIFELMIPVAKKKGYTFTKTKQYLTTKEMCEMANISYSTWTKSPAYDDKRIINMREKIGKTFQYKASDVDEIRAIFKEYQRIPKTKR